MAILYVVIFRSSEEKASELQDAVSYRTIVGPIGINRSLSKYWKNGILGQCKYFS